MLRISHISAFIKSLFRDQSGVSTLFGALLLLSIAVVFLSAFLVYALPAWELHQESEENDTLFLSIVRFSNDADSMSQKSQTGISDFQSVVLPPSNASIFTDTGGGFVFFSDLSIPPESENYLKTESSVQNYYALSSGSVMVFNEYNQLPDQLYFVSPSFLLLCQSEGASFIKSPSAHFIESDGRFILFLSGEILKCDSSPIFGEKAVIRYRKNRTVEIHDFVSDFEIRYVPPPSALFESHSIFYENRNIAAESWLSDFSSRISADFPEMDIVYKDEISSLCISSAVPIEVDIRITEFEIELDSS